jgi:serine/threonine protein kinase
MTVPGYPTKKDAVTRPSDCPSAELLDQFIRLDLATDQRQAVREHVKQCAACQSTLDQVLDCRDLTASLKPTIDFLHDPTIQRLVNGLCNAVQRERIGGPRQDTPIRFEPADDSESLGRMNHYLIRRELASGATGTVFEACDTLTDQPVAIKFIRSRDPKILRRVEREARATGQVHHPSVVSIRSVETAADGRLYLVMPLVAGHSLSELIQDSAGISLEKSVAIILQIADGLAEVHRQGLLHRDIKPANIMVDTAGLARLTDFGLASFVEEDSTLTETDVILGTPAYMSPEQARNSPQIDSRSDIYSLGASLYECLTGTKPFRGQLHDVLRQVVEREPVRPRLINEHIARSLEAICLKTMSKVPDARYATAGQFAVDLRRWQQGKSVSARLPGLWHHARQWVRREPKLAGALATVAATVIAGLAVSWHFGSRAAVQARLAESRFDASLQTINTLADLTTQSLSGDPGLATIRKQVQSMADRAFEPLVGQRPSSPASLVRYLKAMDNLGTIKHSVAGPSEALVFRQRILDENRKAIQAARNDDELRRQWAGLNLRLAVCHIEMRAFPEATAALNEAAAWLEEDNPADQLLAARIRHSRGTIHKWVNHDMAKAAPEFRKAIDLANTYSVAFPNDPQALAVVNNTKGWLSECETLLGNPKAGEMLLREVYAYYATLADSPEGTFANRLERGRTALALVYQFVMAGDGASALLFAREAEPEIRLLQATNPSLMEPAALKIGFGCQLVAAELMQGNLAAARQRMEIILPEAAELNERFPQTTRVWQAYGHAKQMWFIASLNIGDYPALIPFLIEWMDQIKEEIEQDQNAGFNKQLRLLLLANQALALDWSGDASGAQEAWAKVLTDAPDELRPAIQLLSQLESAREAIRKGQPLDLEFDDRLEASLKVFSGFVGAETLYPSTHHMLAEAYALAARVLQQTARDDTGLAMRIDHLRQSGLRSLQMAHAAGFYAFGNRLEKLRNDPLFKPWHDAPAWHLIEGAAGSGNP